MTPGESKRIADTAKALVHPVRVRILEALTASTEPMSPSELATVLKEPLGNVSYHVRLLVDRFGAIKLERTRQVRGAVEHFYGPTGWIQTEKQANGLLERITAIVQAADKQAKDGVVSAEGEAEVAKAALRSIATELIKAGRI